MRKNLLFYLINSKSAKVLLTLLFGLNVAMAQVNLAPSATATASTCNSGACSAFNDLVFGTCGTQQVWLTSNATNPGSSVYIQFDWSTPQAIKGITIHAGYSGTRYLGGGTIQRWNGSSWVTVMAFTQNNTSLCNYDINFPSTVTASKLRIIDIVVIGTQSSNVAFREIQIWQGSIANNDVGVSSIDSPGVFCVNQQNIYATISNFGTNQVSSFNVNWSINGIVQTPIFYNLTTLDTAGGIGANSVKLQLGSYYFPTGVSTTIKAWTSSPNSQTDTIRTNDTSTVVRMPAMAGGTYTIGGVSPNFSTIDSAIMAMELAGICGPVYFNIAPGTYPRTTAIRMGDISGASNINTITFDGGNKLNTRFEGNFTNSAVIILDKSKYVTIKNITFENTSSTSYSASVIGIVGNALKVTISNCISRLPVCASTFTYGYGIVLTATANGAGISATQNDSITIDSCRTVGGGYGIAAYGNQQTTTNRGLVFTNNTIDSCNYMGAYIYRNYNPIVLKHNTVNMQGWQYGYYGVYFYYNQSSNTSISHEIIGNRINNFGYYGIYLYYPLQSVSVAPLKFYNNVISSYTGGSYSGYYGVYLYLPTGAYPVNFYHNTILMNGVQTSNTATCFRSQGSTVINIKNNIFAVYSGGYTPLYLATNPTGNVVNYNNYYNATNPVSGYLLYRGSYRTPATYLGATSGGDSSVNVEPSFVNRAATPYANLAMANGCDGQGVNLSADVPTDITGVTRSLTTPTLGAYEFNGNISNNLSVRSLITP
ncbi:MAG: hypothetical protein IT246_01920, partial [Bacteroidia bacterium]|nr:hypothetical protein [Bacteroidia bacterium]